ncbi:hypothetical protein C8R44DRAFT_877571 [Mycena epipterygia]|nr:hypothetical protein C8R44DRAFT_877571 [Mycena epipterygia]
MDSPLSGISALGGFWSFVNGAFTLIFRANVIYLAFGRRPLSAPGLYIYFSAGPLPANGTATFQLSIPRVDVPVLIRPGSSRFSETALWI